MFDQAFLDRVRGAVDIAEVVGEHVPLRKAGASRLKGLCPFHKEKTPSFTVNTSLQIFKCFGCGAGGNAATFLMRIENIAFPEAIRKLAERAHIPVPHSDSPEDQERRRLMQICETAATLYVKALKGSPAAAGARAYLERRGLPAEAVARFRLGYSSGREIFSASIHPALLARAGLAGQAPDGRPFDRMRNRLVIPIMDENGKVIGFGGRTLDDNVQPKYLNGPDSPLFSKSRVLFALAFAKDGIRKTGKAILVEGYFDAIAAHTHEVGNVVATLGTSLTEAHLAMMKRMARTLIIVYDADTGGNEAALRGLDLATASGFEVMVARLPAGYDPDEFLAEKGPMTFLKATEDAAEGGPVTLFDFRLEMAAKHSDPSTVRGKIGIVNELLPFLHRVPNAIERHAYVKRLAERLDLREHDIEEEVTRFSPPARPERKLPQAPARPPAPPSPAWRAERLVLGGVLRHNSSAIDALLTLAPESFEDPDARRLAERLRSLFEKGEAFSVSSLMDEFQDAPHALDILSVSGSEDGSGEGSGEAVREAARQLAQRLRRTRLRSIQAQLEKTSDPAAVDRLLQEKQRLVKT